MREADTWAAENDVACLFALVDADQPDEAQRAEALGFRFTDVRVAFDAETRREDARVRPHRDEDVDALAAIARTGHRITRFYADPNFDDARCDDLYETWIRNSCAGWVPVVLVVDDDAPVGYLAVRVDPEAGAGSISLIAVAEDARGRGHGSALVRGALDWCSREGLARMTVVTQGRNIAAQRLFQHCGFRASRAGLWFHKWYDR